MRKQYSLPEFLSARKKRVTAKIEVLRKDKRVLLEFKWKNKHGHECHAEKAIVYKLHDNMKDDVNAMIKEGKAKYFFDQFFRLA